ncbi:MAG TPA: cyclic nucleotide-binding protein, partial [Deferribacteraceae bacterium]|nr:cyclic nucleotide-binding protein [Deferribacteraceae bacterium]
MTDLKQLRECEPFNHISEKAADELEALSRTAVYPADTVIFTQKSNPSGFLYFIRKGQVEISAETSEGVEMVVDYRNIGGFFGWSPIFTGETYAAGAKTTEETHCLLIPKEPLLALAQQYPIISNYFNKAIYSQIRKLYREMTEHKSLDPVAQMEAYPFQKRLREMMSRPVKTCRMNTPVQEVALKMTELDIAAIVVCDENGKMTGIVTERDMVRKVLATDTENCLKHYTAKDVMTPNPYFMTPDTYMYEAATFMLRHSIRHLPIIEGSSIAGIVSIQDLMKFRSQKSMLLVGSAKEAETIEELTKIRGEIFKV